VIHGHLHEGRHRLGLGKLLGFCGGRRFSGSLSAEMKAHRFLGPARLVLLLWPTNERWMTIAAVAVRLVQRRASELAERSRPRRDPWRSMVTAGLSS